MIDVDSFLAGYIWCALWAETDQSDDSGGEPLAKNYSREDFTEEAVEDMRKHCKQFIITNNSALEAFLEETGRTDAEAGHDFWLTRQGHGTGFWDREAGQSGEALTKASKLAGEQIIIVGDDGKLHIY